MPPLTVNELCLTQGVEYEGQDGFVVTTLAHSSGQWRSNRIPIIVSDGGAQAYGSALTYARRYGVTLLLALCADDDDDANAADGNTATVQKKGWGVHSPLGDIDPEVADLAIKYADSYKEAISNGTPDRIAEINADMANECDPSDQPWGEVLKRAVWAQLDSKTRSSIKKILNGATTQ
jgi:hypothetical protein